MTANSLSVLGAGAFGTALAMTLSAAGHRVQLWGRDPQVMQTMADTRENARHLQGLRFADNLVPTSDITQAATCDVVLLAVPTQSLRGLLTQHAHLLAERILIACCKGVEQSTGYLPTQIITEMVPDARVGMLTGPSFAADIAAGKPTALTLAFDDPQDTAIQELLSTPTLRLYLTDDLIGAQLGGALKNVVAIAAGIVMGAQLGDSARAALMTRSFVEMTGYAQSRGGRADTLFGLSGFGDLVLTCTSVQSRNFRYGFAFGAGQDIPDNMTVEGVTTAQALVEALSDSDQTAREVLPISYMVSALLQQQISLEEAIRELLNRPLRREAVEIQ